MARRGPAHLGYTISDPGLAISDLDRCGANGLSLLRCRGVLAERQGARERRWRDCEPFHRSLATSFRRTGLCLGGHSATPRSLGAVGGAHSAVPSSCRCWSFCSRLIAWVDLRTCAPVASASCSTCRGAPTSQRIGLHSDTALDHLWVRQSSSSRSACCFQDEVDICRDVTSVYRRSSLCGMDCFLEHALPCELALPDRVSGAGFDGEPGDGVGCGPDTVRIRRRLEARRTFRGALRTIRNPRLHRDLRSQPDHRISPAHASRPAPLPLLRRPHAAAGHPAPRSTAPSQRAPAGSTPDGWIAASTLLIPPQGRRSASIRSTLRSR